MSVIFPPHEVDAFTEHFWGLVQFWRRTERDRLDLIGSRPILGSDLGERPKLATPAVGGEEFL